MRRERRLARLLLSLVVGPRALAAPAERPGPAPGSEQKAAFRQRFPRYIEWPSDSPAGTGGRFVHCVLGDDQLAEALERAVKGKLERGKPPKVRRLSSIGEGRACTVLFVGAGAPADRSAVRATFGNTPVPTVGEREDFAREGGDHPALSRGGKAPLRDQPGRRGDGGPEGQLQAPEPRPHRPASARPGAVR